MKSSMTKKFWCLGNRCLTSGSARILSKGGGQLALEDASRDGIRHLGGGVHCLIRGGGGSSSSEIESEKFHGSVDEDPTC